MARLRTKIVFSDKKRTVTAVESLELRTDSCNHRRFVIGSLKPIAVIVREPDRSYALDMAAQPLDIAQLNLPADFGFD